MKNKYKNIILSAIISVLVLGTDFIQAQTYISQFPGGLWSENDTWNINSPGNTLQSNMEIVSGHTVNTPEEYNITLDKNNKKIDIYGELIINGKLRVEGNKWEINIHPGGILIINGDVEFAATGNGAAPELIINGSVAIYGDLSGNGSVSGNGSLFIEGDYPNWLDGSDINLLPIDPFPIDLINFDAKTNTNGIQLHWSTATEINNDYFTLERSIDGNNWEILAYVEGAGNSNQQLNYEYTDEYPYHGISYYRLKQTDFDGKFEYFTPVAVNFLNTSGDCEIARVTSHGFGMNVWFRNQDPGAIITVSDIYGRILYSGNAPVSDISGELSIDFPRNYSGEIIVMRLQGQQSSDEKKIRIRQ